MDLVSTKGRHITSQNELCRKDPEIDDTIPTKQGTRSLRSLFRLTGCTGHSTYTQGYVFSKRYIEKGPIDQFNRGLETKFNVVYIEGSEFIEGGSPLMKYYLEKFPTRCYGVVTPRIEGLQNLAHLRPAACANALRVFSEQTRLSSTATVIHQRGSCYRLENHGECSVLDRCCRFVLPDYHLLLDPEQVPSAVITIYKLLQDFYKKLGLEENMVQVLRVITPAALPLAECISSIYPDREYWKELPDPVNSTGPAPYFSLKYETVYSGKGNGTPLQLGTIQLDETLPQKFGISGKVLIHFSMGSLERLIAAMAYQKKFVIEGIDVVDLLTGMGEVPGLHAYRTTYFLAKGRGQLIHRIKGGPEKYFRPYVILRGEKESAKGTLTILDRRDNSKQEIAVTDLPNFLCELLIFKYS